MLERHAARRLRQLLPSGTSRPRTLMAVTVDRHNNDPGTHLGESLGTEATPRESSQAIALREHVGFASQRAKPLAIFNALQIEIARALARVGVDHERLHEGQARPAYVQHSRTMRGHRARAGRTRQYTSQIEHAHAAEWPCAGHARAGSAERLGRCVADFENLDGR